MKKGIIIAFGELWLKSDSVRDLLINKLENNLRNLLEGVDFKIHSIHSRIFLETDEVERSGAILENLIGIAWWSPAWQVEDPESFVRENWHQWIGEDESFALRTKGRVGDRMKLIDSVAENIDREVDLDNPDKTIFLEKRDDWFVYVDQREGLRGLPVGSSGQVMTLVSGGIDSPVASYLMMKRGLENLWVHFHSFPLVSKKSIEKVRDLAQVMTKFQDSITVLMVPFADIQKKIKVGAPAKYRTLLYRRYMLRISEELAEGGLVTGESLGQVSSQTLTNLGLTDRVTELPILRPLIGMGKEEIISIAKEIGSYDISIRPHEDCCTLFVSSGQTAKGNLSEIREIEDSLDIGNVIPDVEKIEID